MPPPTRTYTPPPLGGPTKPDVTTPGGYKWGGYKAGGGTASALPVYLEGVVPGTRGKEPVLPKLSFHFYPISFSKNRLFIAQPE